MPDSKGQAQVIPDLVVSRETQERLRTHLVLLKKWNPAINLVSKSTLDDGWTRHIVDSSQVFKAVPENLALWLDFGSGAGFPGMVCCILAAEFSPETRFILVESDKRKCAFLRNVLAETGVRAEVISQRIEGIAPQNASVISARAVASLDSLFELCESHLTPDTICVFPKGNRHEQEIQDASQHWRFKLDRKPSITDPKGAILVFGEIERV